MYEEIWGEDNTGEPMADRIWQARPRQRLSGFDPPPIPLVGVERPEPDYPTGVMANNSAEAKESDWMREAMHPDHP